MLASTVASEAFSAQQLPDLIALGPEATTETVSRAIGGGMSAFRPEFASEAAAKAAARANSQMVVRESSKIN